MPIKLLLSLHRFKLLRLFAANFVTHSTFKLLSLCGFGLLPLLGRFITIQFGLDGTIVYGPYVVIFSPGLPVPPPPDKQYNYGRCPANNSNRDTCGTGLSEPADRTLGDRSLDWGVEWRRGESRYDVRRGLISRKQRLRNRKLL